MHPLPRARPQGTNLFIMCAHVSSTLHQTISIHIALFIELLDFLSLVLIDHFPLLADSSPSPAPNVLDLSPVTHHTGTYTCYLLSITFTDLTLMYS